MTLIRVDPSESLSEPCPDGPSDAGGGPATACQPSSESRLWDTARQARPKGCIAVIVSSFSRSADSDAGWTGRPRQSGRFDGSLLRDRGPRAAALRGRNDQKHNRPQFDQFGSPLRDRPGRGPRSVALRGRYAPDEFGGAVGFVSEVRHQCRGLRLKHECVPRDRPPDCRRPRVGGRVLRLRLSALSLHLCPFPLKRPLRSLPRRTALPVT